MAAYVVLEKAGPADDTVEAVKFVRDGFHWLAFLVPVPWLLWHRLWIEAAMALGATVLLSAIGQSAGLGFHAALLTLLVSIYFGLEGAALRVRALARRGWHEWAVVEAPRLSDAELLYFAQHGDDSADAGRAETMTVVQPSTVPSRAQAAPRSIGLVPYPGKA